MTDQLSLDADEHVSAGSAARISMTVQTTDGTAVKIQQAVVEQLTLVREAESVFIADAATAESAGPTRLNVSSSILRIIVETLERNMSTVRLSAPIQQSYVEAVATCKRLRVDVENAEKEHTHQSSACDRFSDAYLDAKDKVDALQQTDEFVSLRLQTTLERLNKLKAKAQCLNDQLAPFLVKRQKLRAATKVLTQSSNHLYGGGYYRVTTEDIAAANSAVNALHAH